MKYLVVSDNHGDRQILVDLQAKYAGKVDAMFHCGDSELPADDPLWNDFIVVQGNCDYDPAYQTSQTVEFGNDRIYLTHGHRSNVRFGLNVLSLEAQEAQANIALFGHIHQAVAEFEKGILFVNPGSISQPRGPIQIPSYALIESNELHYAVQFYNRAFQPIEELQATFDR